MEVRIDPNGDGGLELEVYVSQDHIDRGEMTYSRCPVALALMDAIPAAVKVRVFLAHVAIYLHDGPAMSLHPSRDTVRWINNFDDNIHVEPFVAELYSDVKQPPDAVARLAEGLAAA